MKVHIASITNNNDYCQPTIYIADSEESLTELLYEYVIREWEYGLYESLPEHDSSKLEDKDMIINEYFEKYSLHDEFLNIDTQEVFSIKVDEEWNKYTSNIKNWDRHIKILRDMVEDAFTFGI